MVLDRDLVADVDCAAATYDGLARGAAAQLALHPDLVVNAKLQLELLAGRHRLERGLADELPVVKYPRLARQEQQLGTIGHGCPQVRLRREHGNGKVIK